MKISGLLCCKKCGVYETEGMYRYDKGRKYVVSIYYWSNLPKRGLHLEDCPKCNPNEKHDLVYDFYG